MAIGVATMSKFSTKKKEAPAGQKYNYRYPKVSDELFDKLVKSQFPPQLLAVVCTDVIPLNLARVRGQAIIRLHKREFCGKVQGEGQVRLPALSGAFAGCRFTGHPICEVPVM